MDRKVVFFDIDGTIWDYSGNIPDSAKRGISQLKSRGHIPVICTGRAMGHVRDEELLSLGFEGVVAACGSHVEYNGKMLYEYFLPDEITREVVNLSNKYHVPIVLEGRQKHWISAWGFKHDDFVDRMKELLGEDAVIFDEYTPDMIVNKFSGDIVLSSDYENFKNHMPQGIDMIYHELSQDNGIKQAENGNDPERVTGVFEAVCEGSSKAHGMKVLCDFLGVDIKDTYAFGDSNNDLEMIEAAGTGIAMGNSSDALKKRADYITDDLCDDGLYNALVHFGLI